MRRSMVFLLASVPIWALCSLSFAEEAPGPPPRGGLGMFERLATDGRILLDELPDSVPEFLQEWLKGLDTDEDGVVTAEEFSTGLGQRGAVSRPNSGLGAEPLRLRQAAEPESRPAGRGPAARTAPPNGYQTPRATGDRGRGTQAARPERAERPRETEGTPAPRAERVRGDRERVPAEREPTRRERARAERERPERVRPDRRPTEPRFPWGDPEALFRRFDRDGDGQLSRREFTAAVRVLQERGLALREAVAREVRQARRAPQRPTAPQTPWMQPPRRRAPGPQTPWMQPPRRGAPGPQTPWMQPPRRGAPGPQTPWMQPPRRGAPGPWMQPPRPSGPGMPDGERPRWGPRDGESVRPGTPMRPGSRGPRAERFGAGGPRFRPRVDAAPDETTDEVADEVADDAAGDEPVVDEAPDDPPVPADEPVTGDATGEEPVSEAAAADGALIADEASEATALSEEVPGEESADPEVADEAFEVEDDD